MGKMNKTYLLSKHGYHFILLYSNKNGTK